MTESIFGDVVYAYTRADAIRDGALIEVPPDLARQAGFTVPVAVTAAVWDLIDPGNLEEMPGQSIEGRLWDLLWLCGCAARATKGRHTDTVLFWCYFLFAREERGVEIVEQKMHVFKAVCGPGDQGEPVVTIMLRGED